MILNGSPAIEPYGLVKNSEFLEGHEIFFVVEGEAFVRDHCFNKSLTCFVKYTKVPFHTFEIQTFLKRLFHLKL